MSQCDLPRWFLKGTTWIRQLQHQEASLSGYGHLLEEIKTIVAVLFSCHFTHVNRCGNKVAHLLAHDFSFAGSGFGTLPFQNPDVNFDND